MNSKAINIVWLKRDLRSQDHLPLKKAELAGIPYLIIYLFEPSRIEYRDTSNRHLQFVYHSIGNLNKVLSQFNRRVDLFYACLLYTSPSPRDGLLSRMPSSA